MSHGRHCSADRLDGKPVGHAGASARVSDASATAASPRVPSDNHRPLAATALGTRHLERPLERLGHDIGTLRQLQRRTDREREYKLAALHICPHPRQSAAAMEHAITWAALKAGINKIYGNGGNLDMETNATRTTKSVRSTLIEGAATPPGAPERCRAGVAIDTGRLP